jgi:hypothetical protein
MPELWLVFMQHFDKDNAQRVAHRCVVLPLNRGKHDSYSANDYILFATIKINLRRQKESN